MTKQVTIMKQVTIIDYGLGNLFSVSKAFEHIGAQVDVTSDINKISNSDYLVLPGVGAFNHGIQELKTRGLMKIICSYAKSGKPLLGICLGMQMMFDISEENGNHDGLGLISGKVVKIAAQKTPHIGWGVVEAKQEWIGAGKDYYFVHSYHAQCANQSDLLGVVQYDDVEVTAAVRNGNVIGYQFHPEKSRDQGLELCKNFLSL